MFDLRLVFSRSFVFSGFASRSEFWTGYLALLVLGIPVFIIDKVLNQLFENPFADLWLGYAESINLTPVIYGQGNFPGIGTAIFLTLMPGLIQILFSIFATVFVAASSTRRLRDAGWYPHLYLLVVLANALSSGASFAGLAIMSANSNQGYFYELDYRIGSIVATAGSILGLLAFAATVVWFVGVLQRTKPKLS